ncbi:hypothetical protein LTR27_004839 [Elasticomyces elasticus]|nr:hypothetical protein LTR27_004839 [Elasticomyces elasticus]
MTVYHSLSRSRKEIRIVDLLPSQDTAGPIVCKLKTVSLHGKPIYEALSYVWGDAKVTRPILLNGERKDVTANLDYALRLFRARSQEKTIRIWLDSICINQADTQERNQQVQIMGDIYQDECKLYALQEALCVAHLFSITYWRRRWVSQELALARSFSLFYGHLRLYMPDCSLFILISQILCLRDGLSISSTSSQPDTTFGALAKSSMSDAAAQISILATLQDLSHGWSHWPRGRNFVWSMDRYAATDPRDLVYALLGLLPATLGIRVDYDKPYRLVYEDAAIKLMKHFKSFEMLYCGHSANDDRPYWLPDWHKRSLSTHIPRVTNFDGSDLVALHAAFSTASPTPSVECIMYDSFNASLGSTFRLDSHASGVLCIPALTIAEITQIVQAPSNVPQFGFLFTAYLSKCLDAFENWRKLHTAGRAFKQPSKLPQARGLNIEDFYRTIFLDHSLVAGSQDRLSMQETGPARTLFERIVEHSPRELEHSDLDQHTYKRFIGHIDRLFFISREGYIGFAPKEAKVGDFLSIIASSPVPFAVRKIPDA